MWKVYGFNEKGRIFLYTMWAGRSETVIAEARRLAKMFDRDFYQYEAIRVII